MTSKWYFTRDNRQKYGPYTTEQLRQFAVEGLITPTDRLLQEGAPPAPDGGRKWKLASEIGWCPDSIERWSPSSYNSCS